MASKPHVKIIAVGKLREVFWQDAQAEYRKRLTAYTTRFEILEVADELTPEQASETERTEILRKEGVRILASIGPREYVVVLDIEGKQMSSEAFAAHLEQIAVDGIGSALTFIVGGSLGLHHSVTDRAQVCLSFGAITLPHQLARIVLLEQLFRAAKIQRGENYHK